MTNSNLRWTNRRRMAWMSLVSGLAYPLLVLVTDSQQLKDSDANQPLPWESIDE